MCTSSDNPLEDLDECPCSGATLAKFVQPAIMTILAGGPLHGYRIVERAAETPLLGGSRPDPTGVYRVLHVMEERGLVVSAWDLSASGPAKKSYQLTGQGKACLHRWIETLEGYRLSLGKLLAAARRAAARMA